MSLILAFAWLFQTEAQIDTALAADEILVVAKPGKCDLSVAGRTVRDPEFKARAAEWAAGRPIRVVVPADARTKCLAKIMFKLNDRGVTRAEFVDAPTDAPQQRSK